MSSGEVTGADGMPMPFTIIVGVVWMLRASATSLVRYHLQRKSVCV